MRAALLPGVAVALVAVVAVRIASTAGPDRGEPASTLRPVAFVPCPPLDLRPSGLALDDRVLRNLGDGVMGRSLTFRGAGRTVSVHVGFDILERLDDLDFQRRAGAAADAVEVLDSRILAGRRPLRAATWRVDRGPARCRRVTVVASGFEERDFRRFLDGATSAPPIPSRGG